MTQISLLKYVQWRPIGVCDAGEGKHRKAKMFSKVDLKIVTSPEIKRENWSIEHLDIDEDLPLNNLD